MCDGNAVLPSMWPGEYRRMSGHIIGRKTMAVIADTSGINNIGMRGIGAYRPERVVTNDEI